MLTIGTKHWLDPPADALIAVKIDEMSWRGNNVRLARVDDARAIAEVHVASWRTTYKGIFSDALSRQLIRRQTRTVVEGNAGLTRTEFSNVGGLQCGRQHCGIHLRWRRENGPAGLRG